MPGASSDDAAESFSGNLLFAKVSQLVHDRIDACEKRITARLDQERLTYVHERAIANADMRSIVALVEELSEKMEHHEICQMVPMSHNSIDVRIEACSDLLEKFETQIQNRPSALSMDSGHLDFETTPERTPRSCVIGVATPQKESQNSFDGTCRPSPPSDHFDFASALNMMLEQERLSRDIACSQLRKDVDALSTAMQDAHLIKDVEAVSTGTCRPVDEDYLNVMLEQERQMCDSTCATLRTDFCKELESLHLEMQSFRASPMLDGSCIINSMRAVVEQHQQKDHISRAKVQEGILGLPSGPGALHLPCQTPEPEAMEFEDQATDPHKDCSGLSPLEARLQSVAHVTFKSAYVHNAGMST